MTESKNATQNKAQVIFQEMSLEEQKKLKEHFPDIYKALFDSKDVNLTAINTFLNSHTPLNLKVRTFEQFNNLSLSDQLSFKSNFPDDYHRIVKLSTSQSSKFEDIQTIDDFQKLSLEDQLTFKKEFRSLYNKVFDGSDRTYLERYERLSKIDSQSKFDELEDLEKKFLRTELPDIYKKFSK
jgi:hypothetical protein